ncbi:hypothetical protein KBK19_16195 [Microvirga sp. STR05]|uniref:GTPase n=1 Tax=Hymenobacter duratus TaxID=2771356 RepID=A0ABR8JL37_9BACT|nr:hypothetical protein [Hymenobacter duratus]MBD2716585.1 hypothetical protein [Hymenobacter duratus]MBR7951500.1 hypothetical protein [Microvirga sp. STR05]
MKELLFVYNANAGVLNGVLDTLHKTLSPGTYSCSLCALTYGAFTMRPEWAAFLRQLPVTPVFLHRDELRTQYPELARLPLPAAFLRNAAGNWEQFLTATELNQADLASLMALVQQRLPA